MIMFFILLGAVMVLGYLALPYLTIAWVHYVKIEGYLTLLTSLDEGAKYQATKLIEWANEVNPENIGFKIFRDINYGIIARGNHQYILLFILLLIAVPATRKWGMYKGLPTIDSLIKTEHRLWPHLIYFKKFDPNVFWNELRGHGRYMLTPFVFCVENKILTNYKSKRASERIFHSDVAEHVLVKSLGSKFISFQDLSGMEQLLVAHCLGFELEQIFQINKISATYFSKRWVNLEKANEYWSDYLKDSLMAFLDGDKYRSSGMPAINDLIEEVKKDHKQYLNKIKHNPYTKSMSIFKYCESVNTLHGYNNTVLIALMRYIKRKGKFTASFYPYFKRVSRELHQLISFTPYYEDDLSHQMISGFPTECIAAFSHYQHELFAKRSLNRPYVGTAVTSIKKRLLDQNIIKE